MYQVPNNFSFRVQDEAQRNALNTLADELQTDKKFENAREFTFAIVSAYRKLEDEYKQLKSKCLQLEGELNIFMMQDECNTADSNADVNTTEFIENVESMKVVTEDRFNTADMNTYVNAGEFNPENRVYAGVNADADELNTVADINTDVNTTDYRQGIIAFMGYEDVQLTDEDLFADCYSIIERSDSFVKTLANHLQLPNATADDVFDVVLEKLKEQPEPQEVERKFTKNEILIECSDNQIEVLDKIARLRVVKKDDAQRLSFPMLIKKMVFNRGALLNWGGEFNTHLPSSRIKNI